MSDWQPIETAPIEKPVLVWNPGLGMGMNVMHKRACGEWCESAPDGRALKDGYYPTHWMSLPPPPIEGKDT